MKNYGSLQQVPAGATSNVRNDMYLAADAIRLLPKSGARFSEAETKTLKGYTDLLNAGTRYIPDWVKVCVALALGLGTMVGWKRIVVTVGEKIGKTHLTYAQGASAEIVAAGTIGLAELYGLPVSTTHILSSCVAGDDGGQRLGAADVDGAQHGAGLDHDPAGRLPDRRYAVLHPAARVLSRIVAANAAPARLLCDEPVLPGLLWAMRFDEDGRGHIVDRGEVLPVPGSFGAGFTWLHFNLNDARLPALIAEGRLGPPHLTGMAFAGDPHQRLIVEAGISVASWLILSETPVRAPRWMLADACIS